jgi:DNA repair exonuclease SbcCD nuclease subunit
MKIAVVTDTHFGARGDKQSILDHFGKFYQNVFFPYLKEHDIKTVWHLGDLVDRRKFINFNTLEQMKRVFLDPLLEGGYKAHFILGNHDMYYKNKIVPNSLLELLGEYNFSVYCDPAEVDDILVVPWMCDENRQATYEMLRTTKASYAFGHLQLKDFEMDRGRLAESGDDPAMFKKFDAVLTGHFHHKSSKDRIHYLGCPYEMTWRDYKDPKGFHIFDTSDASLTQIVNPYKLFHKFVYEDSSKSLTQMLNEVEGREGLKDGYVKVIIKNKTKTFWFDKFIDKIQEIGISDLQIVEDHYNLNVESDDIILSQAEDTLTILRKYLKGVDVHVDINKLEVLLKELYDEAAMIRV